MAKIKFMLLREGKLTLETRALLHDGNVPFFELSAGFALDLDPHSLVDPNNLGGGRGLDYYILNYPIVWPADETLAR